MPLTDKEFQEELGMITADPRWQDRETRPQLIRDIAIDSRGRVEPEDHRKMVSTLWEMQDDRGLLQKGAEFTGRAVEEVVKSIPAAGGAAVLAATDALGITDSGSGTRLARGVADLVDTAGQRLKQMAPGKSKQAVRDEKLEALKADLDDGIAPPEFEAWVAGEFEGREPPAAVKPWIDELTFGLGRLAVEADHSGDATPEQVRAWLESDRNPMRADSDTGGAGAREFLADYIATRDPSSWKAFVERVTETDSQLKTRRQRFMAEGELRQVQQAGTGGLLDDLTTRSAEMQTSPIDLATAALPALRGIGALRAARAGGLTGSTLSRVAQGAAIEGAQEGLTEYLSDARNTVGEVLEAAAMGAVGSGVLEGGMAATGAAARRLVDGRQPPSIEAGETIVSPTGPADAPEVAPPAAGVLAQIAARQGRVDPTVPESVADLSAEDISDLENVSVSGGPAATAPAQSGSAPPAATGEGVAGSTPAAGGTTPRRESLAALQQRARQSAEAIASELNARDAELQSPQAAQALREQLAFLEAQGQPITAQEMPEVWLAQQSVEIRDAVDEEVGAALMLDEEYNALADEGRIEEANARRAAIREEVLRRQEVAPVRVARAAPAETSPEVAVAEPADSEAARAEFIRQMFADLPPAARSKWTEQEIDLASQAAAGNEGAFDALPPMRQRTVARFMMESGIRSPFLNDPDARSSLVEWADRTIAESRGRLHAGVDPTLVAAYAIKGAQLVARGVRDFAAWSADMVRQFGDAVIDYLRDAWRAARKTSRVGSVNVTGGPFRRQEINPSGAGPSTVEQTRESGARFVPADEAARQYVVQPWAPSRNEAHAWVDATPLSQVIDALATNDLPAGLQRGTPAHEFAVSHAVVRASQAIEAAKDEFASAHAKVLADRAALLWRQIGTAAARDLGSRSAANRDLAPYASIMATQEVLIERATKVTDARFEGGTEGVAERVRTKARESGVAASENVASQLQGTTPEERELSRAQRTAQRILDQLARTHADPQGWPARQQQDAVRQFYERHLQNPMEQAAFVTGMRELGVTQELADLIFRASQMEISARVAIARARQEGRQQERTQRFLEKDSPSLVKLMRQLRAKMFPDMSWEEIFTDLPEHQRQRQRALYERIMRHEALRSLSPEERLQLTNELDKAWQRERRKIFNRELEKAGVLGEKSDSDRQKVKRALPKLLRQMNLGLFNSEMFREAVAPEYGLKVLTSEQTARLRKMAEEAWNQPEGILRNRKLSDLLTAMQNMTGSSRVELLDSYWTAAVLSGLRTQFDTWASALNGFATTARQAAMLGVQGDPRASMVAFAEWWRGLAAAVPEALQILIRGDYSYLKRFNEDMMKALEGQSHFRPVPISERLLREGNWWQKAPAAVMVFVSRSMAAADHLNNTATTRGAMAVARALHPEIFKGALTPTEQERANARAQALREVTGAQPPRTREESATVSKRAREILTSQIPEDIAAEASEIGDLASYQNDPTGLAGVVHRALNAGLGTFERRLRDFAEDDTRSIVAAPSRALAAMGAVMTRGVTGSKFARFGLNFASNATTFIPGTYLLGRAGLYGRDLSRSRDSLIAANNILGTAAALGLYTLLGGKDPDEDDWGIEGDWSNLSPARKQALYAAGKQPLSIWRRDGSGKIRRISYRQWEVGMILGTVANINDTRKYDPERFNQAGVSGLMLSALGHGLMQVKDLSALSQLTEIFGQSAYSTDPGKDLVEGIQRGATRWATGFAPNVLKDLDAMQDPRSYKPEGLMEEFFRGVPLLRRSVNDGRPQLSILGDVIELDRKPWSRVATDMETSKAHQVLGKLAARGLWLRVPNTQRKVTRNGERVTLESLGRDVEWKFQKSVGQKYKQWLAGQGDDLLRMPTEQVERLVDRMSDLFQKQAAYEVSR